MNSEACRQVHVSHLTAVGLNSIVGFQSHYLTRIELRMSRNDIRAEVPMTCAPRCLNSVVIGVSLLRQRYGYLRLPLFSPNPVMLDLFVGSRPV